MSDEAAGDAADIDPTGYTLAMIEAAIHAKGHGGDPQAAHKIAALADDDDGDESDTDPYTPDPWDDGK